MSSADANQEGAHAAAPADEDVHMTGSEDSSEDEASEFNGASTNDAEGPADDGLEGDAGSGPAAGAGAEAGPSASQDKDEALRKILANMDKYSPIFPDVVLDHYLSTAGFTSSDVRVQRLIGLAAQKFLSDVAQDAYQYSRIRSSTTGGAGASGGGAGGAGGGGSGAAGGGAGGASSRYRTDRHRTVLTMEDLSAALSEYGVNMRRPEFYR